MRSRCASCRTCALQLPANRNLIAKSKIIREADCREIIVQNTRVRGGSDAATRWKFAQSQNARANKRPAPEAIAHEILERESPLNERP
jgi:hypothetical protein